eukprot:4717518-Pyramimonas_sp.AAC.1
MNTLTPPQCPCRPHRAHTQSRTHQAPLRSPHWLTVDVNQADVPSMNAAEGKQTPQLEGQLEMVKRIGH